MVLTGLILTKNCFQARIVLSELESSRSKSNIDYLNGVDFDQANERRVNIQVEDIELSVICLDDLLVNKKSVGRLKDLLDVEELERRVEESPILPPQG